MDIVQQFLNATDVVMVRQKSLHSQNKQLRTSDPEVIQIQRLLYELGDPKNKEVLVAGQKANQKKMTDAYNFLKSLTIVNDLNLNTVLGRGPDDSSET